MILLPTNILLLPLLILVRAIDAFLFLCFVRALMRRSSIAITLASITDVPPARLTDVIRRWRGYFLPTPIAWLIVTVMLLLVRSGLLALATTIV